jgi:hypothetical protein
MTVGTCDACRGMKRLTDRGLVPVHYIGDHLRVFRKCED